MNYAVLITVDGNTFDNSWDTDLNHIINVCKGIHSDSWHPDDEPSEPGDSEYTYNADVYGHDGLMACAISAMQDSGGNARLAQWMDDRWGVDGDVWWATLSTYQASGILTREQLTELCDNIGLIASGCETMGTLGGPANPIGIAPDIVFECESQSAIVSCLSLIHI